jgi:hypothetical protein
MRPDRCDRRIHALSRASIHVDVRTFARKRAGNRKPDSCGRSCYQYNFSSEFPIHMVLQKKASLL